MMLNLAHCDVTTMKSELKVNDLTQCHRTLISSTSSQETIGIETILLNSNQRVVIYKR